VREEGEEEELDRRSCVPAQLCSARAAAALSRPDLPGLAMQAQEGLGEGSAAASFAASESMERSVGVVSEAVAEAEDRPLRSGTEESILLGQEVPGAGNGGTRSQGGAGGGGGSDGAGGADVQCKREARHSEGAGAKALPAEAQGR